MINFYVPINNLGYGIHSYNFIKALDKVGVELALFPYGDKVGFSNERVDKWIENQKRFSKDDLGVMIFHESYMNWFSGRKRVGFPVFETGVIESDINILKSLDYILQPSEWGKKYLESLGFKNVFLVPEGFSSSMFNREENSMDKKMELLEKVGIVFSHVGKLEKRKSSLDIIRVFTQALSGLGVKCKLVVQMTNPFLPEWETMLKEELLSLGYNLVNMDSSVVRYSRENLTILSLRGGIKKISEVYNNSHFGLYASKAEGWNLPLIESLASGLPCITTKCSGQSQYLEGYPEELTIPSLGEEVAVDNVWFSGDRGFWAKPDFGEMKQILIRIAKSPEKYLEMSDRCYSCVEKYTWDNSAIKFQEFLKEIGEGQ